MNLKLSPFYRKNVHFFLKSVFHLQIIVPLHRSDYSQTQAQGALAASALVEPVEDVVRVERCFSGICYLQGPGPPLL